MVAGLSVEELKQATELMNAEAEGYELAHKAGEEAFEFFELLIENSKDKNYKLMTAKQLAFEVGVSNAMEELYAIHVDMKRKLSGKKYFGSKEHAAMYAHLFLARAFKNVFKDVAKRGEGE